MMKEHFDVIVVGAGISGIGAGYHLQTKCPDRSFVILEGRGNLGGTWDLFRYPGVRSDSDMYTLGYSFKPWTDDKSIADAPAILQYLNNTADEHRIREKIRFGHNVRTASWSSTDAKWTVHAETGEGSIAAFTCSFLFLCSGYYDYEEGYMPGFDGVEHFRGRVVHPQRWTSDIDYAGKRVIVVGSGATAVTLVPALAGKAAHVTMLQRSPSYVAMRPSKDRFGVRARRLLPSGLAYRLTRWKNILEGMYVYGISRQAPMRVRQILIDKVRKALGPDYDVDTHFSPDYKPWDQRLCLVPNGDLFSAIRDGDASVVTEQIDRFTENGLRLNSGKELEADIVVMATGLKLKMMGGISLSVDGRRVNPADTVCYKGMMYSGIPNLASCFGYTNASWTLKCELTCEYICRLLNHMQKTGFQRIVPVLGQNDNHREPFLDLDAGYVKRGSHLLPKQGARIPWKLHQNYALDIMMLRYGRLEDGVLSFSGKTPEVRRVS